MNLIRSTLYNCKQSIEVEAKHSKLNEIEASGSMENGLNFITPTAIAELISKVQSNSQSKALSVFEMFDSDILYCISLLCVH